jgi:hypothetical protein
MEWLGVVVAAGYVPDLDAALAACVDVSGRVGDGDCADDLAVR